MAENIYLISNFDFQTLNSSVTERFSWSVRFILSISQVGCQVHCSYNNKSISRKRAPILWNCFLYKLKPCRNWNPHVCVQNRRHVVDIHTAHEADGRRKSSIAQTALQGLFTPLRAAFTLTFQHRSGLCSRVFSTQKRKKIFECAF